MNTPHRSSVVLGFPDYREPARRLADAAGIDYAEISVHHFPDGESLVRLPPELPRQVVLCGSLDRPNEKLIELELAAAAALQLGARHLTLVAPYLCYMRQDKAFHPGEAVSQRIIGDLLARRFDTLITVDPHLHRTTTLQQAAPVRRAVALSAAAPMADRLLGRGDRPLLIGPDEESAQWVSAIAQPAGLDYGVARKRRLGDRDVRIELPDLDVSGRNVVLVDDVASGALQLSSVRGSSSSQIFCEQAQPFAVLSVFLFQQCRPGVRFTEQALRRALARPRRTRFDPVVLRDDEVQSPEDLAVVI